MTTDERIEALEHQLKRSRWVFTSFVMAGLAVLCVGQAKPAGIPDVITAKQFRVVDAKGNLRIGLMVREDNNAQGLQMYDTKGNSRIALVMDKDGSPVVELEDSKGIIRVALGAQITDSDDGTETKHPVSTLMLFGPDGKVLFKAP